MERKEFYKQLKCFLKELIVVFPESDEDLQSITTSINLAILDDDDANEIIDRFYNALSNFENYLVERNIHMFNESNWDPSSYEYNLFIKLYKQWDTFTNNNKNVIWEYLEVLYNFSKLNFVKRTII